MDEVIAAWVVVTRDWRSSFRSAVTALEMIDASLNRRHQRRVRVFPPGVCPCRRSRTQEGLNAALTAVEGGHLECAKAMIEKGLGILAPSEVRSIAPRSYYLQHACARRR